MDSQIVERVRKFNRFYTKRMGLLNPGYLRTKFPLTQARILFEIAHRDRPTARDMIQELEIDAGYVSRILSAFEKDGFIQKSSSESDNRLQHLAFTTKGKKTFSELNKKSNEEIEGILQDLSEEDQNRLQQAMNILENVLDPKPNPEEPYLLRSYGPGDIGWIISRHGIVYAQEYDFDETFEGLVAEIFARFLKHHDPKKENIWIAEREGERIGTVTIVDAGKKVSQLRCLLVEPKARGMGVGKRLIQQCIDFSKQNGYKKIKLWTQSHLAEARHLYERAGFQIVEKKQETNFGHKLVAEVWERIL